MIRLSKRGLSSHGIYRQKGVAPKGDRYDRNFLVKDEKGKIQENRIRDFTYSSNNLESGSIGMNSGPASISPFIVFSNSIKLRLQIYE